MRESGTSSNRSWRRARRGAALLVIAPILAVGPTTAAYAANKINTAADDAAGISTTSTTAPTQGRLSTGKRINSAADDPAGLSQANDPAADEAAKQAADDAAAAAAAADAEAPKPGDPGTEQLTGEPGTCDEKSCKHLTPIVECSFKDPGTGLYNTVWSYRSGGSRDTIPIGWYNYFTPGKINQGQPTSFEPGMHRSVFITTHEGELTWVLGLEKATAPGKDCGHNPVPITGAGLSSIVTLFAVGGLLGVVLLVLSRRRRSIRA